MQSTYSISDIVIRSLIAPFRNIKHHVGAQLLILAIVILVFKVSETMGLTLEILKELREDQTASETFTLYSSILVRTMVLALVPSALSGVYLFNQWARLAAYGVVDASFVNWREAVQALIINLIKFIFITIIYALLMVLIIATFMVFAYLFYGTTDLSLKLLGYIPLNTIAEISGIIPMCWIYSVFSTSVTATALQVEKTPTYYAYVGFFTVVLLVLVILTFIIDEAMSWLEFSWPVLILYTVVSTYFLLVISYAHGLRYLMGISHTAGDEA